MLTVTPAARVRLVSKLKRKNAASGVAMRFTRQENGWRLRLDKERPHDTAFTHEGRNVLLLDSAVAKAMAALKLDASGTKLGTRLTLQRNPRGGK